MLAEYKTESPIEQHLLQAQPFSDWASHAIECFDANGKPNYLDDHGELKPGIYLNMPNDLYHSLPALSSSGLKKFAKSPAHYEREYLSEINDKRTTAQRVTFDTGTYAHELVLEPYGFYDRYFREVVESDYPDAITKADDLKAALHALGEKTSGTKAQLVERLEKADPTAIILDAIIRDNRLKHGAPKEIKIDGVTHTTYGGKLEIRSEVWSKAHRAEQTVRQHGQANTMFSNGMPEIAFIARCEISGLMLKCKFDWLRFDDEAIDLKTSRSTEPSEFNHFIRKLRYDLQESFYTYVAKLLGVVLRDFVFVAVEFEEADICQPFRLKPKRKENANRDFMRLIKQFSVCKAESRWPGHYENTVIDLD